MNGKDRVAWDCDIKYPLNINVLSVLNLAGQNVTARQRLDRWCSISHQEIRFYIWPDKPRFASIGRYLKLFLQMLRPKLSDIILAN